MLLFFSSACLLALLFIINQRIRRPALLLTSGAGSIFLVIHLLVEGYRVQLLFLYGFTILMLMHSLIDVFITLKVVRTASRIRRVLGRLFIVIGLIATACFLYVFPVFDFPTPTGELKVGTQVFHFIDPSRRRHLAKPRQAKGN